MKKMKQGFFGIDEIKEYEAIRKEKQKTDKKTKYIGLVFNNIKVEPGDIIVIETEAVFSPEAADCMSLQLKKFWPDNEILILEQGTKIKTAKGTFEYN